MTLGARLQRVPTYLIKKVVAFSKRLTTSAIRYLPINIVEVHYLNLQFQM